MNTLLKIVINDSNLNLCYVNGIAKKEWNHLGIIPVEKCTIQCEHTIESRWVCFLRQFEGQF